MFSKYLQMTSQPEHATPKVKRRPLARICLFLAVMMLLSSCALTDKLLASSDKDVQAWKLITDSAKRTEVTVCVDSSDEALITWLKEDFAAVLKTEYNVTLNIVTQSLDKTFEKLADNKANEREIGQYDVLFLNGDTFAAAMNQNYLYGPFTSQMPNVKAYLDTGDLELRYDESRDINGYEIPYARNQLYMIFDENYFYDIPETNDAMLDLFQSFKGQFTYPDPRKSPEGAAFVISLMLPYLDVEKLNSGELTDAEIESAVAPVLAKLKALKPYQYQEGKTFPESIEALDQLYRDGALICSMSLDFNYATDQLKAYEYPEETNVFVIPGGSTGYTDYVGIAADAPNKSAAIVFINALIGPEAQGAIYDPKNMGMLPIYNPLTAPSEAFTAISSVKLKSTTLKYEALLNLRYPEVPLSARNKLINLWTNRVFNEMTGE